MRRVPVSETHMDVFLWFMRCAGVFFLVQIMRFTWNVRDKKTQKCLVLGFGSWVCMGLCFDFLSMHGSKFFGFFFLRVRWLSVGRTDLRRVERLAQMNSSSWCGKTRLDELVSAVPNEHPRPESTICCM